MQFVQTVETKSMCTIKNRCRFVVLAAIMLLRMQGSAQVVSDTTGTLTWSLNLNDNTLVIGGSGAMPNYNYSNYLPPWTPYRDTIFAVAIGDSITNIGDYAFYYCSRLTSATIPNSVSTVGGYAFFYCTDLASVSIPNSVTGLGSWVFAFCSSLTAVTVPASVENIGDNAFYQCSNLISVSLPDKIASIEDYVFYQCGSLTTVTIPDKVAKIGRCAFQDCVNLTAVNIPDSVASIGDYAFINSNLTVVTVPARVESIGSYAFGFCRNLTSINVNEDNMFFSSEDGVLFNKSKTTLIQYPMGKPDAYYAVPDGVTDIGTSAFRASLYLTAAVVSNSVTTIAQQAFANCGSLKSVTIGNSVTYIGYDAFNNPSTEEVFSLNENPPATAPDNSTFADVDKHVCVLHLPAGCKNKYLAAPSWKDFLLVEEDAGVANYELGMMNYLVYPNPTTGKITIRNEESGMSSEIGIYDMAGKKLLSHTPLTSHSSPLIEIDISHLANGMYFLKVQTNNGTVMKKVVKE